MQETMETTQAMIDHLAAVNKILEKYGYSEAKLIPILQEVQAVYKYLSRDMISYVATSIGVPPSRVYGVATFYAHFSMQPKGKYIIKLCDGTACHVKKSHGLLNALYERLNLSADKRTSSDLLFAERHPLPRRLRSGSGHDDQRRGLRTVHPGARGGDRREDHGRRESREQVIPIQQRARKYEHRSKENRRS